MCIKLQKRTGVHVQWRISLVALLLVYTRLAAQTDTPNTIPTSKKDYAITADSLSAPIVIMNTKVPDKKAYKPSTQVELGGTYEYLTNNFTPWSSFYLQGIVNLAPATNVYAILTQQRRFSLEDFDIALGGYYPLDKMLIATAELHFSPTAKVIPIFSAFGQAQILTGNSFIVNAGYRFSRFVPLSIHTLTPGVEWYVASLRFAYTLYGSIVSDNGTALSNLGQVSYYFGDNSSISLSATLGRENVAIAPNVIKIFDIAGVSLSGRQTIVPQLALSYEFLWQRQGSLFDRFGGRLGIRYQFFQ
jgi:YaiO family outer membrane protein